MDKEKVVTIAIGLVIGLLAAGGYYFLFKDLKRSPAQRQVTISAKPTENKSNNINSPVFSWDLPLNSLITSEKAATVSGTAVTGSRIIIVGNADQDSLTVGSDGKFSAQVNLEEGENKISLTYLEPNKPPVTLIRQVFLEI